MVIQISMMPGTESPEKVIHARVRTVLIFALTCCCMHVWATEWQVRPGESITTAMHAAHDGDIVLINRGYYVDHLVIDKPVTLRGMNRPTISGDGQGDVIRVKASHVVIEGLIIRDSGSDLTAQNAGVYIEPGAHSAVVRHNDLAYNLFGLWIEKANDVVIEGNVIKIGRAHV